MRKGFIGAVSLAVIIILAVVIGVFCTVRVPAGYVAVQYSMSGGVKDEVLTQGFHLVSPTITATKYTVGLEQSYLTADDKGDSEDDESFSASSKEGKELTIDLTFTYQYKQEDVVKVFNEFKGQDGKEVRDSFIKPNIVSWSKEVIARYQVADILGEKRADVNKALTEYLSNKFAKYGITISNVSLINVDVDKTTKEAINAKIKAQQEAETQKINNQKAIDKAKADKEVAEINAEKEKISADAEAYANKKISDSLSENLINYNAIEKWNGETPKVSGSGSTIIDFDSLTSSSK